MDEAAGVQQAEGRPAVGAARPYDEDEAARQAYGSGVALLDRSQWGLIRLTGSTRHTFLHNQTTADFQRAVPGSTVEAVVLTGTARIVDWVRALVTEEAIWLITSPERRAVLLDWFPRFVFFMDDVQFSDESERWGQIALLGPESGKLLAQMGGEALVGQPDGQHAEFTLAGIAGVRVVVGAGLMGQGYTLLIPAEGVEAVRGALRQAGAEPMSEALWDELRVAQGRPVADRELTEAYNPLEAGLWSTVSFAKGCYIGQEIVARLDTYQKLKQQLWGLRLSEPVEAGAEVTLDGKAVGTVTSVADAPDGPLALAYLRTSAGHPGKTVEIGSATASVVDLPLITRGRQDL